MKDFSHLVRLAYEDEGMTYVTTRVTANRGLIVANHAAVIGGRLGQQEPRPIHARDVKRDLKKYHNAYMLLMWSNNAYTRVCNVVQGRFASDERRPDHPHDSKESAPGARIHAVGAPPDGGYGNYTAAVVGQKTSKAPPVPTTSAPLCPRWPDVEDRAQRASATKRRQAGRRHRRAIPVHGYSGAGR